MSIGGFLLPKFNGCQCSLVRRFAPYSYRWFILGRAYDMAGDDSNSVIRIVAR